MSKRPSESSPLFATSPIAPLGWAIAVGAILPLLAGCNAPPASAMGHRIQQMSGASQAEAFRKANKKCNEYGRAAETVAYDGPGGVLTFRCIEP